VLRITPPQRGFMAARVGVVLALCLGLAACQITPTTDSPKPNPSIAAPPRTSSQLSGMALADIVGAAKTWQGTGAVFPLGQARGYWSDDGTKIVISDNGCEAPNSTCNATRLIDAKTGRSLYSIKSFTSAVKWSPDGRFALMLQDEQFAPVSQCNYTLATMNVIDLQTLRVIASFDAAPEKDRDFRCTNASKIYWPTVAWMDSGSRFVAFDVDQSLHPYPIYGELSLFEVNSQGVARVNESYGVDAIGLPDFARYAPVSKITSYQENLYFTVGGNQTTGFNERLFQVNALGTRSVIYTSTRCSVTLRNLSFSAGSARFSEECIDNQQSDLRMVEVNLTTRETRYLSPIIRLASNIFRATVAGVDWVRQRLYVTQQGYPGQFQTFNFSGGLVNTISYRADSSVTLYWTPTALYLMNNYYADQIGQNIEVARYANIDTPTPIRTQWLAPPSRVDRCINTPPLILNPNNADQAMLLLPSRLVAASYENGGCFNFTNEGGAFALNSTNFSSIFTLPGALDATHLSNAYAASAQPGGPLVASAGRDGTVKLWDATNGRLSTTLTGHTDSVYAAAWKPDGSRLATAGKDARILIWDPSGIGRVETTLTGHSYTVRDLAWSPNGTRLASASWDKTVKVWNSATGENLLTLQHDDVVNAVAYAERRDNCQRLKRSHREALGRDERSADSYAERGERFGLRGRLFAERDDPRHRRCG
jgi:WD domain, G-beta repeat